MNLIEYFTGMLPGIQDVAVECVKFPARRQEFEIQFSFSQRVNQLLVGFRLQTRLPLAFAPPIINHAGGTTTVHVNQQTNGGVWNALGTFTFNAGTTGSVVVDNTGTNGIVIADAIRLTP